MVKWSNIGKNLNGSMLKLSFGCQSGITLDQSYQAMVMLGMSAKDVTMGREDLLAIFIWRVRVILNK